jgi:type IV pilus assembly protein PilB
MNTEIRELAFNRAPVEPDPQGRAQAGMRPLSGDGKLKILAGKTTPDEIAITRRPGRASRMSAA